MFGGGGLDGPLDADEVSVRGTQVDLFLAYRGADAPRNFEVVVVLFDLLHADAARVTLLLRTIAVRVDDLSDVLGGQSVLFLPLIEMLRGVDEKYIVGLLASLENQNTDRDPGGVEEVRR